MLTVMVGLDVEADVHDRRNRPKAATISNDVSIYLKIDLFILM